MQHLWLNRKKSLDLIVFFSGWGMDGNSVLLDHGVSDFIVFYNYESDVINDNLISEFLNYKNIFVIAWSMGVIMSTLLLKKLNNIKRTIAINGTLKPIDDKFGIPERIFTSTLNNLNKSTMKLFLKNMGYKNFKTFDRTFESQLEELKFIEVFCKNNFFNANFDKIFMGAKDIIIPYRNQRRAWEKSNTITINDGEHYMFHKFNSWKDIIC